MQTTTTTTTTTTKKTERYLLSRYRPGFLFLSKMSYALHALIPPSVNSKFLSLLTFWIFAVSLIGDAVVITSRHATRAVLSISHENFSKNYKTLRKNHLPDPTAISCPVSFKISEDSRLFILRVLFTFADLCAIFGLGTEHIVFPVLHLILYSTQ